MPSLSTLEDTDFVERFLQSAEVESSECLVGIHACSVGDEHWDPLAARVATALQRIYGARILFIGQALREGSNVQEWRALDTPLLEFPDLPSTGPYAAAIARCDLLLTPDGEFARLAMASGTPVVILFGPMQPKGCVPLDPHRVVALHGPNGKVTSIPEHEILDAAEDLLASNPKVDPNRSSRSDDLPPIGVVPSGACGEDDRVHVSKADLLGKVARSNDPSGARPPTRILVKCSGNALGDIMMHTSALRSLAAKHPGARVEVYGRKHSTAVLLNSPIAYRCHAPYVKRGEELARIQAGFDCVFNLSYRNTIGAPAGLAINAYELSAHRVGAEETSGCPEYYPTKRERTTAAALLRRTGLPLDRPIATLHLESVARNRTFPITQSIELASALVARGWSVIVLGLDEKLMRGLRKVAGVVCFHDLTKGLGYRQAFAPLCFARLFVGIDGACSHIAQALGVPSVLLYGPISPYLRAKHFRRVRALSYGGPCGPCQQSSLQCSRFPGRIAPCMRAFSLEEILRACEEVVSGAANEVMDDGPERGWKRRSCPCCTSIEARFATQKGTFQYWRCKGCRSLFVGNPPHPAEQVEHYRRHYRALAPKFRDDLTKDTARVLAQTLSVYAEKLGFTERRLLDVGCGTGALQRWLAEDGWSGLGLEPGFGPEETLRPPGWEIRSQLIEQYLETSAERFPFVTFVNSLGTLANPAHVLRGTHELLTERGVVIALLPSSDFLPRKRQNTWRPLNTAFAGLHLVLPSAIGLARLARRSGFQCVTTPIPRISGYVAELIPWCPQV